MFAIQQPLHACITIYSNNERCRAAVNNSEMLLIDSNIQVPIYAKHSIVYREGSSGRFDVSIGHKNTAGKTVGTC